MFGDVLLLIGMTIGAREIISRAMIGLALGFGMAQEKAAAATLAEFVELAVSDCAAGLVPGPIAKLIDVPRDAPACNFSVRREQVNDEMHHLFQVLIETDTMKPVGLVLSSDREWSGRSDGRSFRASLAGRLEKAIVIHGKRDEQGESIRGSGTVEEENIGSKETRRRFQHELDLWLKRSYLRKEWRSGEFSEGKLKAPASTAPNRGS